jgi:NAD(P)-dependent dehydrogenase (short-subunit alcohol dehydrogenase family)
MCINEQVRNSPVSGQVATDHKDRIKGKTFVVTGCSSGIGQETALRLAQQGGRVVMACRNKEKMAAAAEQIRKEVPDAALDQLQLDLGSMVSLMVHWIRTQVAMKL